MRHDPDPAATFQSFMNGINARLAAEDAFAADQSGSSDEAWGTAAHPRSGRSCQTRPPAEVTVAARDPQVPDDTDERLADLTDELRAQGVRLGHIGDALRSQS